MKKVASNLHVGPWQGSNRLNYWSAEYTTQS